MLLRFKMLLVKTPLGKYLQRELGSQSRLQQLEEMELPSGPKLNIGCGELHLDGYINIDASSSCEPDLLLSAQNISNEFSHSTIACIQMIHGIGYLNFDEAKKFFRDAHSILLPGGYLIIETPSIGKISASIVSKESELEAEDIFPIFATSHAGPTHGHTYQFIWDSSLLIQNLRGAGFTLVQEENPISHGKRIDRDIRIIAKK